MINLIPKEEKKKMVKFFYYKVVILFLVMMSLIVLMAFISILPAYFLSSVKNNIINTKLAIQKLEPMPKPDEETLGVIKELNDELDVIERARKNQFTISKNVINAIILKKLPDIKISDISYENDPVKGKKVSIQGTAPSREVLLLFRLALEDDVAFSRVDLPISNFVKGSNIKFYLSLIPS